jgi:phosphate transport system substrate-binding protein
LNAKIKALTVDGEACSNETIASGSYHLVRPIYLLVNGPLQGEIKAFIEYVLSDNGQQTIKANGLMPAR